jgi:imidazolonepropionase-like amidohydrolase
MEVTVGQTVFRNVNLLTGIAPARAHMSVTVDNDLITSVVENSEAKLAPSATVIDLAGKTMMPGLVPCHVHLDYDSLASAHGVIFNGSERPPGVTMAYAIKNARLVLQGGTTSAIGAGSSYNIDAQLKMAISEGVADGPRMLPCSAHINALGADMPAAPWWLELGNRGLEQGQCTGPIEFRREVRRAIACGAEIIKLIVSGGHGFQSTRGRRTLSPDELAGAIHAAHERGAKIRAHVAYKDQILEALKLGLNIVDHGDEVDDECVDALLAGDASLAPTPVSSSRLTKAGLMTTGDFEATAKGIRAAHDAGVNLLIGDDYGIQSPGIFGINQPHSAGRFGEEMAIWVEDVGIDPLSVIKIATANGARAAGFNTGIVEPGRLADLLILDSDPVDDIRIMGDPDRHLLAVLKDGQFVKNIL